MLKEYTIHCHPKLGWEFSSVKYRHTGEHQWLS